MSFSIQIPPHPFKYLFNIFYILLVYSTKNGAILLFLLKKGGISALSPFSLFRPFFIFPLVETN